MPLDRRTPETSHDTERSASPGAIAPPDRQRARRWRLAAPVVAVVALALAAAACMPTGGGGGGGGGDVVQAVNQDRAAAGLGGLAVDGQLAGMAQNHAQEIANSGSLWHSNLAAMTAGWRGLGENLLVAPTGTNGWSAEDMWMGSPPHRANILNGGFNRIGVGTVISGGRVWMVAMFGTR